MKYSVLPPDLFIIGSIWNVSVGVKALQCSVAERPHFPFLHSFRSSHGPHRGQCKDCAVWPSGDGRAALHSRDVLNGNVFKERMLMLYASLFTEQSGGWWLKHRCTEVIGHLDAFRILAVFMVFDCLFSFLPLFSFPLTGCLRIWPEEQPDVRWASEELQFCQVCCDLMNAISRLVVQREVWLGALSWNIVLAPSFLFGLIHFGSHPFKRSPKSMWCGKCILQETCELCLLLPGGSRVTAPCSAGVPMTVEDVW